MSEIKIFKPWQLNNPKDQFVNSIMEELQNWEDQVGAKEIASTIKWLLKATTLNAKWDVMDDNSARLNTLKLVMQLNWVKLNQMNVNIFNIQKPWKDEHLNF